MTTDPEGHFTAKGLAAANGVKVPDPVDQAISINPFDLTHLFVNYTIKNASHLRGTKVRLAVNNLFNSHNIVGVSPAIAPTAAVPYVSNSADALDLLPGRGISISVTGGWAPRR